MKQAEKNCGRIFFFFFCGMRLCWILSELCSNWQFSVFCCTQTNTSNRHEQDGGNSALKKAGPSMKRCPGFGSHGDAEAFRMSNLHVLLEEREF